MKAKVIINLIRSTNDESATRLLENIFSHGYVNGIKKAYDNMSNSLLKRPIVSDADAVKMLWLTNYEQ